MALQGDPCSNHSYTSGSSDTNSTEIVTLRPDTETLTRQRLPYFVGFLMPQPVQRQFL